MTTFNSHVLAATTSGPVLTLVLKDRTDSDITQTLSLDVRDGGPDYGSRTLGGITAPISRMTFFKTVRHYMGDPAVGRALSRLFIEGAPNA